MNAAKRSLAQREEWAHSSQDASEVLTLHILFSHVSHFFSVLIPWIFRGSTWTPEVAARNDCSTNAEYLGHQRSPSVGILGSSLGSCTPPLSCRGLVLRREGGRFWEDEELTSWNFPLFAECVSVATALMCSDQFTILTFHCDL